MKKLTEFLEKNVEWVAIGLGGVWVLWVLWAYYISSPAAVDLPGHPALSPGQVDRVIYEGPRAKLEQAIRNSQTPRFQVNDPVPAFAAAMSNGGPGAPMAFTGPWLLSQPGNKVEVTPTEQEQGDRLVALPEVAKPTIDTVKTGRSSVLVPSAGAPIVAGNAGNNAGTPTDLDWVTVFGKFDLPAQQQAFAKASIPEFAKQVNVVEVRLLREEQLPDGSWGKQTLVRPLQPHRVALATLQIRPKNQEKYLDQLDLNQLSKSDQHTQLDWAQKNAAEILTPSFYQWLKGDQWTMPAAEKKDQQLAGQPFNAARIAQEMQNMTPAQKEAVRKTLTMEQRQQVYAEEQKLKEKNQTKRNNNNVMPPPMYGPGMYGPMRPVPPGGRDAQDARQLRDMYAQAAPPPPIYPGGGMYGPPPVYPGSYPYPGGYPGMPPYGPGGPMMPDDAGNPMVQPGIQSGDWWAHDETVEPGRTYRYRVQIRIKNPLFDTNLPKDPKLAKIYAIPDKSTDEVWSDWTDAVSIPARSEFFIASVWKDAKVDVFKWQNGSYNKETFSVMPGDMIGGTKKDVDYTTGWTVVDVRGNNTVVLVDKDGRMQVRTASDDRKDPRHDQLITLTAPPVTPPTTPGGYPPGPYPPGMGGMPPSIYGQPPGMYGPPPVRPGGGS